MQCCYDENTAIDRISVSASQLAVFPQQLKFGKCLVTPHTSTYFVKDYSITIPQSYFVKFADILINCCEKFKNKRLETNEDVLTTEQEATQDLSWKIGDGKIGIKVENNLIRLTIECELTVHQFDTEKKVKDLVTAFTTLVLKSYCYSPLIHKFLKQFIDIAEITELEELTEDLIYKILPRNPNILIDFVVLSEIILRHKKLLIAVKKLNILVE